MRKIKKEREEIMIVEVSPTDHQKIIELFRNWLDECYENKWVSSRKAEKELNSLGEEIYFRKEIYNVKDKKEWKLSIYLGLPKEDSIDNFYCWVDIGKNEFKKNTIYKWRKK